MMADIMFTKKQYKDAIYHYEQLLENKPDHYEVNVLKYIGCSILFHKVLMQFQMFFMKSFLKIT